MTKVLIVEDDRSQLALLEVMLKNKLGFETLSASNGKEAIDILTSPLNLDIELVLLDLGLPVLDGYQLLEKVKPLLSNTAFIVTTASSDIEAVVRAMKLGASDFLTKPIESERLRVSINNVLRIKALSTELDRLNRDAAGQITFSDIIGNSSRIKEAIRFAKKASASAIAVLLEGESGVGKELFARAIHGSSSRAGKPFVAVNCGAIPDNLVESILFGHEKGAFTGATYKSLGKFREAEGGTIFLDEVAELKPETQIKLLRVLQQKEVEPVGGNANIAADVRVIAATNKNLSLEVVRGNFREDLYYRLNILPISLPSLRDRKEDIVELAISFMKKHSAEEGKIISKLTESAIQGLIEYRWPGNIRQLDNAIFRAVVLSDKNYLDESDFKYLKKGQGAANNNSDGDAEGNSEFSIFYEDGNLKSLDEIETEVIKVALNYYNGRITEVARRLGVGRSTIYRKIGSKEAFMGNYDPDFPQIREIKE